MLTIQLSLLDVDARDAFFLGYDPRWDVAGAERSGIRPILFDPSGNAETTRDRIGNLKELLPLLDKLVATGA